MYTNIAKLYIIAGFLLPRHQEDNVMIEEPQGAGFGSPSDHGEKRKK